MVGIELTDATEQRVCRWCGETINRGDAEVVRGAGRQQEHYHPGCWNTKLEQENGPAVQI